MSLNKSGVLKSQHLVDTILFEFSNETKFMFSRIKCHID